MDAVKTGGLVAQARKEKKLTQKELAERLHVSTQAVSKWERGRSCPDISLLEPLAEALELTVTELLSGQRGEEPKEELVRDSLRFGENQLRPKIRRWRGLFLLAAVLLLALVLWLGYRWVRDNTGLLAQRETVVVPMDVTDRESIMVKVLSNGNSHLYMYDVTMADNRSGWRFQLELMVSGELAQSWVLNEEEILGTWKEKYPRRQLLALGFHPEYNGPKGSSGSMEYTLCFGSSSLSSKIEDIPCLTGGMISFHPLEENTVVDPEEGVVLLALSVQGLDGYWHMWGTSLQENSAFLVFKLYCT